VKRRAARTAAGVLCTLLVADARADPPALPVVLAEGRFVVEATSPDAGLARALLRAALASDSFPGLPRPRARVRIQVAPDADAFRALVGPGAPEWGAAIALPAEQRTVLQGGRAGSGAGDPLVVLRHELAHLALHERLGGVPPRWFDEGYASYAAGEVSRFDALATSVALVARGVPPLDSLDGWLVAGAGQAAEGYALAHTAVAELAALDGRAGLDRFFARWHATLSFDQALRGAFALTAEGFDRRYRSVVRQRFGVLALAANLSLVLGGLSLVLGPLFLARRRRDRRRLEALRAADLAQEREAAALAALLGEGSDAAAPGDAPSGSPVSDAEVADAPGGARGAAGAPPGFR
jgi:hypothetical protein